MNEREEESGGAHGWVLGSRNSCEHMCFLPFVLCFVGPFFMPSHLNSTAHKSVVLLLTGLYFSVRFYRLYIMVLSLYLPIHISTILHARLLLIYKPTFDSILFLLAKDPYNLLLIINIYGV